MFVPVSCSSCGKPFQVPEAALGTLAPCPWCQAVVTALPVAATGEVPQPLSLDAPPPLRTKVKPLKLLLGIALVVVVMSLTVAILGYGSGRVPESAWTRFTPPDGSCSVLLPGSPREEETNGQPTGSVMGGKRYTASGWYSRTAAWLAWNELEPSFARSTVAAKDKEKVYAAAAIETERNREKARLEGTITKEVEIRFGTAWGIEVHMDTPRGKVVEWLVLVSEGARPRLYAFGIQAKNIAPDSAIVRRMFTSFQANE